MHRLFIKVGENMNIEQLLYKIHNSSRIVYLDSSSLIRTYPINALSKKLTRCKYISNPQKFSIVLNRFIIPLENTSASLYNIFNKMTNDIDGFNIISYDCMFPSSTNCHISTLFGSFDFDGQTASINNSTVLFDDNISVETFFNASTLIRSANLILIDDHFLSLSVGKQLLERKKENTPTITLSSLIGNRTYNTKEVIDIFNCLSHYHL